jgi:hypothetical protein
MRAALCLLLLLAGGAAHAAEPGFGSWRYRIHHQLFGDIGRHEMSVTRQGDAVVIEHVAELAVRLLGITAFQRQSRFREVWRGDRLFEFDGLIVDNGERFPVTARAEGDHLVIEGSAGRFEAPPDTVPGVPSLERAIRHGKFFDNKTGEPLEAKVAPAGRADVRIGRASVRASHYEVAGDLVQDVWYDEAGVWVQWRLWRQGAAITLLRETP